jgi:tRNA-specific 2-thiouridylase
MAREAGLPTWAKKDSTGICFIGERPFRDFLARYLPRTPGPVVAPDGRAIGRHEGLAYYTLGQRQGLGIGGVKGESDEPWFVAGKDFATNSLVAVQGHGHPLLYRGEVEAIDMHWIAGVPPELPARLTAKTRYRMPDAACLLSAEAGRYRATFEQSQWTPTPGQYLVLYDGDVCLGGGVIAAPERATVSPEVAAAASV